MISVSLSFGCVLAFGFGQDLRNAEAVAAATALAREAALRNALDSAAQVVVACAHAIIVAHYRNRCEMCACGGATGAGGLTKGPRRCRR
jgi:hypothetical protein